jgi:NADPH-dependent 2,4-dienoyl-CoA reductase/sulfur reductase-like enzyme
VELARSGGLTVENGIVTDAYCLTSGTDVYAAGDAARFFHPPFGRVLRLEAWRHAERHGQVAALNMLGQAVEYRDVPWMWSDQYDLHFSSTEGTIYNSGERFNELQVFRMGDEKCDRGFKTIYVPRYRLRMS